MGGFLVALMARILHQYHLTFASFQLRMHKKYVDPMNARIFFL